MLTAITLASCKTSNLIPGKFEAVDGEQAFQSIGRLIKVLIAALN
jgi:hypothetical protein